ncbi:guanine-specific ribonuclease N1 and T1 [Emticicia oligotrophica DSM 17448]|uniref:Guanine-specific ribonuclease N1 and T1 n=2 Tax=Leadbetterellaceae TaxID=3141702 RepID=A0ABM5N1Z3_EMTOG|nr:guanine-specific ribonuclease N1 and T1 [Emticicia oligotrophica DSM 17448]
MLVSQIVVGCRQASKQESFKATEPTSEKVAVDNTDKVQKPNYQAQKQSKIPKKVYEVLNYVKENGVAPDGYVGGRKFGNYEKILPQKDDSGRRINYQEWDVNPKKQGKNRGAERLVTGSDGRAYYTNNHYKSFVEIK